MLYFYKKGNVLVARFSVVAEVSADIVSDDIAKLVAIKEIKQYTKKVLKSETERLKRNEHRETTQEVGTTGHQIQKTQKEK